MLIEMKRVPRLVVELGEEKYIKSLRTVTRICKLSRELSLDCLLPTEKELICSSIERAMNFKFNLKIHLMDNPSGIVPLKELDLKTPVNEM